MRVPRCAMLVALVVVGACGTTSSGITATHSKANSGTTPGTEAPPADTSNTTATTVAPTTTISPAATTTVPLPADVIDFGKNKTPQSYDNFLEHAFADIEAFWAQQFPKVFGGTFKPLSGGIFAAYPKRTEPIPGCGTAHTTFNDVKGNAFYCSDGDFIVYDDDVLLPQLVKELGQSAVGIVMAHEFGHSIQARTGNLDQPTILKEQQADCFAGAWSAHVARGEANGLTFKDADIRSGLIAMIQVRDPLDGVGLNDANAHGTGFDRVGAFQDGFDGGVERCKTFFTEDRQSKLIDIPFDPQDPNQGNLPLFDNVNHEDIVTLIPQDLTRFWTGQLSAKGITFKPPTLVSYPAKGPFPSCSGVKEFKNNFFYCKATNQIMFDSDLAESLVSNPLLGDMSVGYLIGDGFAEAVQLALKTTKTGEDRVLLDDCLTGAWIKDIVPPIPQDRTNPLSLSAGDLDEAIVTAIIRSDDSADTNVNGSAFEKVAHFRLGVLNGLSACLTP